MFVVYSLFALIVATGALCPEPQQFILVNYDLNRHVPFDAFFANIQNLTRSPSANVILYLSVCNGLSPI
jgi:hypothetical protein